jgi:hypothetical protein
MMFAVAVMDPTIKMLFYAAAVALLYWRPSDSSGARSRSSPPAWPRSRSRSSGTPSPRCRAHVEDATDATAGSAGRMHRGVTLDFEICLFISA